MENSKPLATIPTIVKTVSTTKAKVRTPTVTLKAEPKKLPETVPVEVNNSSTSTPSISAALTKGLENFMPKKHRTTDISLERNKILESLKKYSDFFNYQDDLSEIELLLAVASENELSWFKLQIKKAKEYDPDDGFDDEGEYEEGKFLRLVQMHVTDAQKEAEKQKAHVVPKNAKIIVPGKTIFEQILNYAKTIELAPEVPEDKKMPGQLNLSKTANAPGGLLGAINQLRNDYDEPRVEVVPVTVTVTAPIVNIMAPPPPLANFEDWKKQEAAKPKITLTAKVEKLPTVEEVNKKTHLDDNKDFVNENMTSLKDAMPRRRAAVNDDNDDNDDEDDWG